MSPDPREPDSRPASLADWLRYLETLHPKAIALGLDRVRTVYVRLQTSMTCPVVTVTGTNGKGSTCAMLESMLRCAGFRVGLYTSPHLLRYNERVRIDGVEATDVALVEALNRVEDARVESGAPVALTYFEFGTLAALWLFARAELDVAILEVGLGGRLDAVNIVDSDVAVVTTIDLDHADYLGPTREDVGREKAGIFRAGRVAVCGEADPPASLIDHAGAIGSKLVQIGRDFGYVAERGQWRYWGPGGDRYGLPHPALRGPYQLANAATAIAALDVVRERLPVSGGAIRTGLVEVELRGRFQVLPGRPAVVLDVAHNPHAARALAATAGEMGYFPETLAVFGIFADKDIDGVIAAMRGEATRWFVATLPGPRGAAAADLAERLVVAGVAREAIVVCNDVSDAWCAAREAASEADRIIVFGSFLTVAAVMAMTG
jgi:dihydrofolate synthase/folylpolyglutamate synthase